MATLNGIEFQILTIEWATYQNNVIQEVIGGDTVVVHSQGYRTDPVKIQGRVQNEKELDAFQEEFYSEGVLTFIKNVNSGRQYQIYALGNIKQEDSSNDKSQTGIIFNCLIQLAYPYMESTEITTRSKTITTQNQEWSADNNGNDIKTDGNVDAMPDIQMTGAVSSVYEALSPEPVGEPSFETVAGWVYSENDTDTRMHGAQSSDSPHDGSYCYKFTAAYAPPGDWGQIARNVNLTYIENLNFWYKNLHPNYMKLYVIIDAVTVWTSGNSISSWTEVNIDLSSYSGTHSLIFKYSNNSGSGSGDANYAYIDDITSQKLSNNKSIQIYNIADTTVKLDIANTILDGEIYKINIDGTGTIDYDDDFTSLKYVHDAIGIYAVTYDDSDDELDIADDGYIYWKRDTKYPINGTPTLISRINITSGIPTIQISADANTWYDIDTAIVDDIETTYPLDSDGNLSLVGRTLFYWRIDCVKAAAATCSVKYFKSDINIHTIYAKNPKITKGSSASTFRIDQDSDSGMACIVALIYRDKWWV